MSVLAIVPWLQGLVRRTQSTAEHFWDGEFPLKLNPAWTRGLLLWRGWPSKPVGCNRQIGDQLTTPFYLSVGHAYACNRHLRFSTGSQMDCSSLVTCGVFGGNSFSLGKCTQPNFPCSLTAVGMAKITSQGPFHFGNSWSLGEPLFPGFKKNLVPRVYL